MLLCASMEFLGSNIISINQFEKVDIELINFDEDDVAISQSLKERVQQVLDDDEDDTSDMFDPDKKTPRIQGIDY